jgi:hypothetical protein
MATATKLVQVPRQPTAREEAGRLLRAEDVAAITGLSVETLAQWRSQRKGIPFLKLSRNCVRYQQADLAIEMNAGAGTCFRLPFLGGL